MTFKLLMALIPVVASAWIGHSMAGCASRRTRTLTAITEGLKKLRAQMLDQLRPLPEALLATSWPVFQSVGREMRAGGTGAWQKTRLKETRRGGRMDCLRDEDLEVLDTLFADLGNSGRSGQAMLIDGMSLRLEALAADARAASRDKDRLYTTLGLLVGLTAAVLLL